MLIADGTYICHQKIANNEYQRKSYSGQKKTSLCKSFTLCLTDGFIADVMGSYYASDNDATLLKAILDDNYDIFSLLKKNYVS